MLVSLGKQLSYLWATIEDMTILFQNPLQETSCEQNILIVLQVFLLYNQQQFHRLLYFQG